MFKPKEWLNDGETGATPITNRDLSRIEYGLSGAIGKEINTQYLMKRNTYNISSCMVGDGWIGGSYANPSNGTVSSISGNVFKVLTGTTSVQCYVDANLGGMSLPKVMDLSKFDSGILSDNDNDWIRYSIWLELDSLEKLGSIAIMFRTALDVSSNYAWYYISEDNLIEGWNHIAIRKGYFYIVGTFDWKDVTGVSFFTYPTGSDEITFIIECLEMVKDGINDSEYSSTIGNCVQPMGTQLTSIKYGQDWTNTVMSTYRSLGLNCIEDSKIWVNYSGADSCMKFFSGSNQTTGEFQICEDFFMEGSAVYEVQFKAIGSSSNRYRISNLQFWQTDKHSFIEFYIDAGSLTCHTTINGFYDSVVTSNFTIISGHVYTLKIYHDNDYFVCVIWDNASTGVVGTVGGKLEIKEQEVFASQDYYSYSHANVFRPFFEIRTYGNSNVSDIIYSIKQYKV
jgi:hypothetical protein